MRWTPDLGKMTAAPFTVLFIVPLFDINFKRIIYYIIMFLWCDTPFTVKTFTHDKLKTNVRTLFLHGQLNFQNNEKNKKH